MQAEQKVFAIFLFSLSALSSVHIFPKNISVMPRHISAHDYAHFGHVMDTKKHVSNHN
jgi:hypothetical protein